MKLLSKMEKMKLKISGMHCKSCEMLIRDILEDEEIDVLNISEKTGILEFNSKDKISDIIKIKKLLLENKYKVID